VLFVSVEASPASKNCGYFRIVSAVTESDPCDNESVLFKLKQSKPATNKKPLNVKRHHD
jgi:hypothetical protein